MPSAEDVQFCYFQFIARFDMSGLFYSDMIAVKASYKENPVLSPLLRKPFFLNKSSDTERRKTSIFFRILYVQQIDAIRYFPQFK